MINLLFKLVNFFKAIFLIICITSCLQAQERLIIGTTTSTYDTGLMSHLVEEFQNNFQYPVHTIVRGTGQILRMGSNGDLDIIIVHNEDLENQFMINGYGSLRYKLMYNDFIIVGPKTDPAKIKNAKNISELMLRIFNKKPNFISRADNSGTYLKEIKLWNNAGIEINSIKEWYKKVGQGMGASLNIANSLNGYILVDKGTWISFNNKDNLTILYENSNELINQYSIILVNKKLHNSVNKKWGTIFIKWILSDTGKNLINKFKKNQQQLFFFNADKYITN